MLSFLGSPLMVNSKYLYWQYQLSYVGLPDIQMDYYEIKRSDYNIIIPLLNIEVTISLKWIDKSI